MEVQSHLLPSYLVLPFSMTIVLAAEWSGTRSPLSVALWWHLCWDCCMRLSTINDEAKTVAWLMRGPDEGTVLDVIVNGETSLSRAKGAYGR